MRIPHLIRTMCFLLLLVSPALSAAEEVAVVAAPAHMRTIRSGITTDSTQSSATAGVPAGNKSFYGEVVCSSGACTQTQAIYGSTTSATGNGILLCTLSLSGTPRAQGACPVITAVFPYYYVTSSSTSGTSATGAVYVGY